MMHFGNKITILYLSFVALILTLVFSCYSMDVELVSPNYYAEELAFQQKIDAINNEKKLTQSINHVLSNNKIALTIDSALLSPDFEGTINLFRPSDSKMDVKLKMNFKNKQQTINTQQLIKGAYKLQLSWKSKQQNYYKEEVVFIH